MASTASGPNLPSMNAAQSRTSGLGLLRRSRRNGTSEGSPACSPRAGSPQRGAKRRLCPLQPREEVGQQRLNRVFVPGTCGAGLLADRLPRGHSMPQTTRPGCRATGTDQVHPGPRLPCREPQGLGSPRVSIRAMRSSRGNGLSLGSSPRQSGSPGPLVVCFWCKWMAIRARRAFGLGGDRCRHSRGRSVHETLC